MNEQSTPPQQDNQYEIKVIHDKTFMLYKNNMQQAFYLIEWKGYPQAEDFTWEPMENLKNATQFVYAFEQKWRRKKRKQQEQRENKKRKNNKERSQIYNEASYQHQLAESESSKFKYLRKGNEESTFTYKSFEDCILPHDKSQQKQQKSMDEERQKSREKRKSHKHKDRDHKRHRQPTSTVSNDIKTEQKSDLRLGKIVNHVYNDRQMFYEVEKLNHNLKPVKTILLPSQRVKTQCLSSLTDYLEQYLMEIQEYNRPS